MRELVRIFLALVVLDCVAFAPPASGAPASDSVTQAEAENFVRSFYHDLEEDDLDKVMARFDQTVQYYDYGAKDRPFIANDLEQYCANFPSRSFSVGAVKLTPVPNSDRVSVKFDVRFFLRNPDRDLTRSGRSHVDWDLAKREGALKITRFNGELVAEPTASPSK